MAGLFDGTPLERPVTCERCNKPLDQCACPRDASGSVLPPSQQSPRVRREKRRGKWTTVLTDLDPSANDLPKLLKTYKAKFATGGALKDNAIELQGDHKDALVELLKSQGFKAKGAGG